MNATVQRTAVILRCVAVLLVLAVGLSGCRLMALSQQVAARKVPPSPRKPSILVVLTDDASDPGIRALRSLLASTARADEHLLILDGETGAVLASSVAPGPASTAVAGPPPALPPGATSFQKARHAQAMARYEAALRAACAGLRRDQQVLLIRWAAMAAAQAGSRLRSAVGNHGSVTEALSAATADSASLVQAGMAPGPREAVAILAAGDLSADIPPDLPLLPSGVTLVVSSFTGTSAAQAAWQAAFLRAGAARAVILTPAASGQLAAVVRQGLDGAITDTLSSVLFGLGQAMLRPAARPQLDRLLWLLRSRYPGSAATIDGYTDSLPAPGGNLALSMRRADTVRSWLVGHGILAGRLQAAGYGAADPVAQNNRHGQPLNRRVVVVIDPAA